MIFRQLLDPETSTYTYLLGDERNREAVLIDSVREQFERDRTLIRELSLKLLYTLETHVHADHVTASGLFREALDVKIAVAASAGVQNADLELGDGDQIRFGSHVLEVRATPGHTAGCVTYVLDGGEAAFTGDALLIRGCGRTDFQQGDPSQLFHSVRERILQLPDSTPLYPGHDYKGRLVTTVAEEKAYNQRLGLDKTEADFVAIMQGLKLSYPKRIDEAVPANLESGLGAPKAVSTGPSVAGVMEERGRQDADAWVWYEG